MLHSFPLQKNFGTTFFTRVAWMSKGKHGLVKTSVDISQNFPFYIYPYIVRLLHPPYMWLFIQGNPSDDKILPCINTYRYRRMKIIPSLELSFSCQPLGDNGCYYNIQYRMSFVTFIIFRGKNTTPNVITAVVCFINKMNEGRISYEVVMKFT